MPITETAWMLELAMQIEVTGQLELMDKAPSLGCKERDKATLTSSSRSQATSRAEPLA